MYVTIEEYCERISRALVEECADKQLFSNNGYDESDFSTYPNTPMNSYLRRVMETIPKTYEAMKEKDNPIEQCIRDFVHVVKMEAKGPNEPGLLYTMLKRIWIYAEPADANPKETFKKVVGDIALRCGRLEFSGDTISVTGFGSMYDDVFKVDNLDYIFLGALEFMPEVSPPRFFDDKYLGMTLEEQALLRDDDRYDPWAPDFKFSRDAQFYVLTNFTRLSGSVAIFYPRLLKRIYAKLREGFYVLPKFNAHAIIFPISRISLSRVKQLAASDKSWNPHNEVNLLTNSVYKYNPSMDTIVLR
ncbi:MAG: DUF5688 family protein [Clostridiales bacterium]|nr:DUF5688 family protein [Clostridiales bacterium]